MLYLKTDIKKKIKNILKIALIFAVILVTASAALFFFYPGSKVPNGFRFNDLPQYSDKAFVTVNDNVPYFTKDEITEKPFEKYSALDMLGRCGVAIACLDKSMVPSEERGYIGNIKPTGWHTVRYDDLIEEKYLYNRCHLIAYMLTGENANEKNLITGTRYFNTEGMLIFETIVSDYINETNNHVMYRVSPVFIGKELVSRGVLMEAYSVEDNGNGISFNIFVYNVQPGVTIDYANGKSRKTVGGN